MPLRWAHLLRDFSRIGQRPGLAGQIGQRLLGLGFVMFRKRDRGQLADQRLEGLQRRIHTALQRGAQQGQCARTAKTCANILKLWPALWTLYVFTWYPNELGQPPVAFAARSIARVFWATRPKLNRWGLHPRACFETASSAASCWR